MENIDISLKSIIKIILVILGIIVLYLIRDILMILAISLVFVVAIDPLVDRLQKKRIPRFLSVLALYVIFIGFFIIALWQFVPALAEEFQQFSATFPKIIDKFISQVSIFEGAFNYNLSLSIERFLEGLGSQIGQLLGGIFITTKNIIAVFVSLFIFLVVSFYLATEEKGVKKFLRMIFPKEIGVYTVGLFERVGERFSRWLRSRFLLALIIGVSVWLGLTLLGIRFALVLAFLAGVLDLIPIAGPIIAAIPAIILALFYSPLLALAVLLLYIVVQLVENVLLVPKIMQRRLCLHPVIIILAIVIGGELAGVLGIIIALPLVIVIQEFLKDWGSKRKPDGFPF